jgi:hypothetical protein
LDPGYALALEAANHFLHAWQTGDVENGMVLLSDNVRRSQNAEQVEQFFSIAKDNNRAFEISRGRGHRGRYSLSRSCWSLCEARALRANFPKWFWSSWQE